MCLAPLQDPSAPIPGLVLGKSDPVSKALGVPHHWFCSDRPQCPLGGLRPASGVIPLLSPSPTLSKVPPETQADAPHPTRATLLVAICPGSPRELTVTVTFEKESLCHSQARASSSTPLARGPTAGLSTDKFKWASSTQETLRLPKRPPRTVSAGDSYGKEGRRSSPGQAGLSPAASPGANAEISFEGHAGKDAVSPIHVHGTPEFHTSGLDGLQGYPPRNGPRTGGLELCLVFIPNSSSGDRGPQQLRVQAVLLAQVCELGPTVSPVEASVCPSVSGPACRFSFRGLL